MTNDTVALIEEKVDSKLRELMAGYSSPYQLGGNHRDEVERRYTIQQQAPLGQFDSACAKAYDASDKNNPNKQIYALVLDKHYSYRMPAIESLVSLQHPHLVNLIATSTVHLSSKNEAFQVVILDKPTGRRLSEVIQQTKINQEHIIKDVVLVPLCKALLALRERQVVHGNINLHSIYVGDSTELGECIGEPIGFSQHYLYEPLERMMADPLGKGPGNEKIDVYAAAILTYELLYGLEHIKRIPKDDFIRMALDIGMYGIFSRNLDFSESMQDFFRGALNDNPNERWGMDQFQQWIGGKRFNMINPTMARDAVRPILFDNKEYYSQRALAFTMRGQWRDSIKDVRQMKLDRWAEMSLHRPETAEKISRVLRSAGTEMQATERQNNDMMTRLLCILDPLGPIRTMLISVRPDGIGAVIADMLRRNLQQELQQVVDIVEMDIGTFWGELSDAGKTLEFSNYLWKLQRVRLLMKNKSLGFGIERGLYDLNPHLPCQSPLVKSHHVTSTGELLKTLDALAKSSAPDTNLVDRHIAAFITSKLDMGKEVKLHDLQAIPALMNNQELVMIRLLAKAQQKNDKLQLQGLCTWIGMRIELMIDAIHNRAFRKRLKLQLKGAAASGIVGDMFSIIVNRDIVIRDYEGFAQAIALHQINEGRIDRLRNQRVLEKLSNDLGGRISAVFGYLILGVTIYLTLSDFMGW